MINANWYNHVTDHDIEVTLYSNNWELDISVGKNDFYNTISLTKKQVGEVIQKLEVMYKEMI
jgi:hypothetical protein